MRPLSPVEITQHKALFKRYETLSTLAGIGFMICILPAAAAPDYRVKAISGIVAAIFIVAWYAMIRMSRRYRIK